MKVTIACSQSPRSTSNRRANILVEDMKAMSDKLANFETAVSSRLVSSGGTQPLLFLAGLFLSLSGIAYGQQGTATRSATPPMQQHYEAAFRFQSAGNLSQADSEYKLFLSMVLHRIANGDAHLGDYARAAPLYGQALEFNPDDRALQMDYAGAALDAADWGKAKALASSVLDSLKSNAQPPDHRAVSTLAQALLELGEHEEALQQFKAAAQLHPSIDTYADVASAYLVLGDRSSGAKIVDEMPKRFGDTAALHMQLGTVYGRTKFFEEAIEEFNKAIAKQSDLKGAHYSLGASYMMRSGEAGFDKAEAEFRKEIALDPDNSLVYAPLGQIAMNLHKYGEAEADLKRAIALNPGSAGTYLKLGQVYKETGRISEAETAFRKAIAMTLDPSANGYEVEQAHFWLGRLLVQSGNSAEGRKELEISQNLLYLKEQQVQSRLSGDMILQMPLARTREAGQEDLSAEKAFEKHAAPVIASSYDNLGVNAANTGDFAHASNYFQQAAQWNPTLKDVYKNWGRAALAAKQYAQAVEPLSRIVAQYPEDAGARSMLGLSLCIIHDYAKALEVLQPIAPSLDANPQLAIAYAGSMAMAGDSSQGLARLKALEAAAPDAELIHYLIGEAYASKQDYVHAADELHAALRLEPANTDSEDALALADLGLGQKAEALQLLSQLAESGSADGEIYYRLAKLQIELGSAKAAIGSLQAAIRINPMDAAYHQALAEAYRQNAQPEEAERESRRSETLRAQSQSKGQSGSGNSESSNPPGNAFKMRKD